MAPTRTLVVLLLLALLAPPALAQSNDELRVEHDETWDADRVVEGDLNVTNNATLTILASHVALRGGYVHVDAGSRLVVASRNGTQAILDAGDGPGWRMRVDGNVSFVGEPGAPVVLDGMAGTSGRAGEIAQFQGGIAVVGGHVDVRHARFQNYTAGLLVGNRGRIDAENATFASPKGIGLMLTLAVGRLDDVAFEGAGGSLFVTVPPEPILAQNLTFTNTSTALTLRNGELRARHVEVHDASTCLAGLGRARFVVQDFVCDGFDKHAVDLGPVQGASAGTPKLDLDGFRIATNASIDSAVYAIKTEGVRLANGTLGPVEGTAILAQSATFTLENVAFHGVTRYGAALVDPLSDDWPTLPPHAGELGNLRILRTATFRVVDGDGDNLTGADVRIQFEENGTVAAEANALSSATFRVPLEVARVDGAGTLTRSSYAIRATAGSAEGDWKAFVPDNRTHLLTLKHKLVPGLDATSAVGALLVACAALVARRRR